MVVAALLVGALGGASPSVLGPAGHGLPRPPAADADAAAPATAGASHSEAGSRTVAAAPAATPAVPGDVAIAPPPETFDEVPAPPAAPPKELLASARPAGDVDTGVWAVIIGVNDYPGRRADLRSAVNDANDMDEALARLGVPAERRLVLRDREATAAVIADAAEWLARRAGPDATAVFFYAGHVRKTGDGTEAMVAADGDLVTDDDLAWRLAPMQAKAWVVMASCFGGGFTEVLGPGRLLTAAADANSLAYENSGFGRSYLVQYMVRRGLIEGNAAATAQEAYAYAEGALRREYPNRVPFQVDQAGGPIPLSMPVPQDAVPPPPPPPPPASAPNPPPPPQRSDEAPPPEEDDGECAGLNLGVVTCGP